MQDGLGCHLISKDLIHKVLYKPIVAWSNNTCFSVTLAGGGASAAAEPDTFAEDDPAQYEAEVRAREKALGPSHPDVAESLSNLAILYSQRNDYAKVRKLLYCLRKLSFVVQGIVYQNPVGVSSGNAPF